MGDWRIDTNGASPTLDGGGESQRTPTPSDIPQFQMSEGLGKTLAGQPDTIAEFRPGERIGNQFEVVRLLGRGGMGMVYEVTDHLTRQRLALKTVLPSILSNPKATTCPSRQYPGTIARSASGS